jgi:hypothetical protein
MNRRYALLLAALLAFALTGCKASGMTAMAATSRPYAITLTPTPSIADAHNSYHKYKVSADVGMLVVDGKIGDVTVIGRDRPGVVVTAHATYSTMPPDVSRTVSDGTLTVGYTCSMLIPCTVSFVIEVPSSIAVQVDTETGSIWLKNLAGTATAKAGAGYIYAYGLTAQTASFSTDAGWISATFASPPANVTASTLLGTIQLMVPTTVPYRMNTSALGGTATISVPQSTTATRTINASTNLGFVDVTPSQL